MKMHDVRVWDFCDSVEASSAQCPEVVDSLSRPGLLIDGEIHPAQREAIQKVLDAGAPRFNVGDEVVGGIGLPKERGVVSEVGISVEGWRVRVGARDWSLDDNWSPAHRKHRYVVETDISIGSDTRLASLNVEGKVEPFGYKIPARIVKEVDDGDE